MFVRHFCSNCFLENVLGTQPFADYCRRRSIPFAQQGPPATQRDSLRQWVEALGQLPPERQARVELELTRVSEVACSGALDQLLAAGGARELPADAGPGDAALALWFFLHRPDAFHEVFLH